MQDDVGLPKLQDILKVSENTFTRTKTVCTVATMTSTVEALVKLLDAGMSGVRILMSQFDQKAQLDTLRKVREARALRPQCPCCVMLETRGADLVVGPIKHHQTITLVAGQELQLVNSAGVEGDSQTLVCANESLPRLVKMGDFVFFDDGAVTCQVTEVLSNGAALTVVEGGEIAERRSIIIPGAVQSAPALSDRDEDDVTNVVLKQNVDFLILSYVHSAAALESVRENLASRGSTVRLLVKLQSREALEELPDILALADGVVISTFELSLNVPRDRYTLVQEAILAHANASGKPVLLLSDTSGKTEAWQRLESAALSTAMVTGVDGLIFAKAPSAEVLAQNIRQWRQLCAELESSEHFRRHLQHSRHHAFRANTATETACEAAVLGAIDSNSSLIIALSGPDFSIETMMKFKPSVPLLLVSPQESAICCLLSGCFGIKLAEDSEKKVVDEAMQRAKDWGIVAAGQSAVVISGAGPQNNLGTIKVMTVA